VGRFTSILLKDFSVEKSEVVFFAPANGMFVTKQHPPSVVIQQTVNNYHYNALIFKSVKYNFYLLQFIASFHSSYMFPLSSGVFSS
jgi:hypothetical protein